MKPPGPFLWISIIFWKKKENALNFTYEYIR
jgi:hypothetical protein